jgi:UDP:flavonoid glycosyltransferase YjiC (YdhE family)
MSTYYAFTSPAAGHLFPMVPGSLELQARGHDVHLRTAPALVDAACAAGLRNVESIDPRIMEFEADDYASS